MQVAEKILNVIYYTANWAIIEWIRLNFLHTFRMDSYLKWGVKTGFTIAPKFFMLISDGLGGVLTIRPQTPLSLSEGSYLCVSWHNKSMAPLSSMGSFDGLNSSRRLHNVEEAERKKKSQMHLLTSYYNPDLFIGEFKYRKNTILKHVVQIILF